MTNYTDTIYPDSALNDYPDKLCYYLANRFFRKDGGILLDVGCGKGTHLKCFKNLGFDVRGVDLRENNIELNIKHCDVESNAIPFSNGTFDFAFSKSLVEHVRNTDNLFGGIYRVLKPGGLFVCMTPDWKSQMSHFFDDYTHLHPFTRKSLRNAMIINGFKGADCEYFYQLPFIWKRPFLKFIPVIISALTTQDMKWKDRDESNGKDRKLIRFSKEKMLLAYGYRGE